MATLSILELDRQFAAEAPRRLKVAERLRRQLLARKMFSGSTLDKRGRMFLHYTAPRSHALPESIEVLRDGSLCAAGALPNHQTTGAGYDNQV